MNVPFTLADAELDKAFLSGAEDRGMLNLKGHRSVGGMRASIYNAVPMAAVESLVNFMSEFEMSTDDDALQPLRQRDAIDQQLLKLFNERA